MFCTECGTKLSDDLFFCTNCGKQLRFYGKPENSEKKEIPKSPETPKTNAVPVQNSSSFVVPVDDKKEMQRAMFKAVKHNDVNTVKAILDAGYKVNKRFSYTWLITPLGFAAMFDCPDVASLLIQRGAPVKGMLSNCGHTNHTPIMIAALNGSIETAKILIQAGADVNATSANGNTALKMAELRGFVDMERFLIQHGAKRTSVRSALMKGMLGVSVLTSAGAAATAGSIEGTGDSEFLREKWTDAFIEDSNYNSDEE